MSLPGARQKAMEIFHETYTREGTTIAFPMCIPGETISIPADESHITALDITRNGIVYGGTSGRAAHFFTGMFTGSTGMVFDLATIADAESCTAVCCGNDKFIGCVNDAGGGHIFMRDLQEVPFDITQESSIYNKPLRDLGYPVKGERIIHAVRDVSREHVVGITENHLFVLDIEKEQIELVGEVKGSGKLIAGLDGNVFGMDEPDALFRFNLTKRTLERNAVRLPGGNWQNAPLIWARDNVSGKLYVADNDGYIFSFLPGDGFSERLGKTNLSPVKAMAVTHDGRLFGFCGEEISNMFCYNPAKQEVTDNGVAASVIERRRYGYIFGDAVLGRDGQIYFGEDDDLGHLWIYFPTITKQVLENIEE